MKQRRTRSVTFSPRQRDNGHYRIGKGRRVAQESLEQAIVAQVSRDLISDSFVAELAREARRMSAPPPDSSIKPPREQVAALSAKSARLATLAAESEAPRPFLEQIRTMERQRETLLAELETWSPTTTGLTPGNSWRPHGN